MSKLEFRLLPWEHRGLQATPAREVDALVDGRWRRFAVKSREGRVYFRLGDEDDARVWTLLAKEPTEEFEAFFRREVEADRVARFFTVERGFSTQNVEEQWKAELETRFHASNLEMLAASTFAVAVSDDGRVWAHEWCGGPWLECALRPRSPQSGAHKPSIWQRGWNVARLRSALAPLGGQFAFRSFTPDFQEGEHLRFASGSREELARLFRTACLYFVPRFKPHNISFPVWNNQGIMWKMASPPPSLRCLLSIEAESARKAFSYNMYPPMIPDELLRLLIEHNLPVGLTMHAIRRGDEGLGGFLRSRAEASQSPLRVDFAFTSPNIRIDAEVPREPSAHERMESFLTLRDWLEDNRHGERARQLLQM